MIIRIVFFLLLVSESFFLGAQQSSLHFIPPIYTVETGQYLLQDYALFLSTTEDSTFYVKLYEGTNEAPFDSVLISRTLPKSYDLGSGGEAIGLVDSLGNLNKPLDSDGLFLKADFPFFANTRGKSNIHGGSLTSKGLAALGKDFRTGHMVSYELPYDIAIGNINSHFVSVMATENNTRVRFSDFNYGAVFHGLSVSTIKGKRGLPAMKDKVILLQKGQSYIIAEVGSEVINGHENASFGLHITSNHPIAVNVGSIASLPPTHLMESNGRDIGFDQIVPIDRLGNEYVVMQGEGTYDFEKAVMVATKDNTVIFVNNYQKVKLDAGDYFISDYFVDKVMHLKGNYPFYVYQNTAGSHFEFTCGFNFLPAWNECLINTEVAIADFSYLSTTHIADKADSIGDGVKLNVTSKDETKVNIINPLSGESYHSFEINKREGRGALPFNTASYKLPSDLENILVTSDKPINLSLTYKSQALGAASYFSGFVTPPNIEIDKQSISSFEEKGVVKLKTTVSEGYEYYQWYKDGVFFKKTTENRVDVSKGGKYKVVGVRGNCKIKSSEKLIDLKVVEEENKNIIVPEKVEKDVLVTIEPTVDEKEKEDSVFLNKLETEITSEEESKQAILPNLNFEYNTAVLVTESKELLQRVIELLKHYPKVTIKITAHTDCRGSETYNQNLSEQRANYVKEYMVSHGIDVERLSSEGMGEKVPLNHCRCNQAENCSEEEFLANRRVEFVVLSK